MIYLFTVGISFSGKSWLVQKITEKFPKRFAVIDSAHIHDFLNRMDPFKDDNSVDGTSYKLRQDFTTDIRKVLIQSFSKNNIEVIQDSCNLEEKARQERIAAVKEVIPDVKTVLIYVNTDKGVIESRVKEEDLKNGNTIWHDLCRKQLEKFEIPTSDEADYYIEYDGKDWKIVVEKVSDILRNTV